MTLETVGWLFTCGVLAHNAEESLFLPNWSQQAGRWYPPVGEKAFRFGAVVLSAILLALAIAAPRCGPRSIGAYLMAGYALAMVLNVIPHLLTTSLTRRYMPGTATALLFNVPLGMTYVFKALSTQAVQPGVFAWSGALITVCMLALIPVLFCIGRKLFATS